MFGNKPDTPEHIDERVRAALDELELKYELDDDGDFRFIFDLEEGRSQVGFIRSRTYDFAGVEIREVYSAGLRSKGNFDPRTTNILLEQNMQVKIGSWGVMKQSDEQHVAIFTAKVSADLTGPELIAVILAVLKTADDMEERLDGRDEF